MNNNNTSVRGAEVSHVQIRFVEHGRDGLFAWASCILGGAIALNNIAVRHDRGGILRLTYPTKLTSSGDRHTYFNPVNRETNEAIKNAILRRFNEIANPDRAQLGDRKAG